MKPPALASDVSYATLKAAIRGLRDNGVVTHARITIHDRIGTLITDTFYNPKDLLLLEANIRADRLAESRRSGSVKFEVLTDKGFQYVDPLQTYEYVMYLGVETDTYLIWIPLGHLWTTGIQHTSGSGRQLVSCELIDGSTRVRENPWKVPASFSTDITYTAAIQAILADRRDPNWTLPLITGSVGTALMPKTMAFAVGDDPWAAVWNLAQSAGGELFHDRDGVIRLRPITAATAVAPALELLGDDYEILDGEMTRKLQRFDVFNGVTCKGSAPWLLFPISATVWDTNPLSPTYYLGSFGQRPKIIDDAAVTSDAQCLVVATAEFNRVCGVRQNVDFRCITDPTVEVGSTVRVLSGGLLQGLYVLDTTDINLMTATMNAGMRKAL